jgi:hypothetical protein
MRLETRKWQNGRGRILDPTRQIARIGLSECGAIREPLYAEKAADQAGSPAH